MLSNSKLLIDKNCPMCSIYGKCFKYTKMVDENTISSYQEVEEEIFNQIDTDRAKSEIALVNHENGQTVYGIDAFITIFEAKSSVLGKILRWFPIYFILKKLYRFISFNRQVITGPKPSGSERDCSPPVHFGYRIIYMLLGAVFTGFILNKFSMHLNQELGLIHQHWREFAICFGQIFWQLIALQFINKSKQLEYIGNMTTISIIGGLLLIPFMMMNHFFDFNAFIMLTAFGLVVTFMLVLHLKRCKNLGLPLLTSISWVAYRSLILCLILISIL